MTDNEMLNLAGKAWKKGFDAGEEETLKTLRDLFQVLDTKEEIINCIEQVIKKKQLN